VERKQFHILATSFFALAILLAVFNLFGNSNDNIVNAQMPTMMPSIFPSTSPTNPPSNDQVLPIFLVAIAVVAVALTIGVLYFVFSRIKRKDTPHIYKSRIAETSIAPSLTPVNPEERKPFEIFLCYKKSSGKDYADHLKSGLEELGVHTFEDCKDIPPTVTTEEGWARIRDQALAESKYFVLLMTHGFDLSSEVVKEIAMARNQANKTFIFFRHRSMGRKIVVNLGDEVLDIGKLEQVSFESKEELLRLAINILRSGKP
jgi:hypothetical protein